MSKSVYMLVGALVLTACATAPSVLTDQEKQTYTNTLTNNMATNQEQLSKPVSLYDAMARALKYNLDHRIRMMELDLSQQDFSQSRFDLLPQLVANSGYYGRDNQAGSSSLSLLSGRQSLEPSTSTQRNVYTANLTASWNVLDFGLSYIRARQLGDETLIYEERRRKVIIEIMENVHTAYWRAASAQRLRARLESLETRVQGAFESSRKLFASRTTSPLSALAYQRELNQILIEAQTMYRELEMAKMELASLMNLPADAEFTVAVPEDFAIPGNVDMPLEGMIRTALSNRPEIRESAYAVRIGEREARKVILETLPNLETYAGFNTDSNNFLFNNDWSSYGARASWNLVRLFDLPVRSRRAKATLALEEERALAAANAVVTQIKISRAQYSGLQKSFATTQQGTQVQAEILQQVERSAASRKTSTQTLVREQMNMIVSEAQRDIAYADLQASLASLYSAIGFDPYSSDITGQEDLETISASFEKLWTRRYVQPISVLDAS